VTPQVNTNVILQIYFLVCFAESSSLLFEVAVVAVLFKVAVAALLFKVAVLRLLSTHQVQQFIYIVSNAITQHLALMQSYGLRHHSKLSL
jgi:hypothetical protein